MHEVLQFVFKISLIVFMVGNLLTMGLQLNAFDALAPLRNRRFVGAIIIASFFYSPTLAYLLTLAIPMKSPYVTGMLLLGFAPSAPFLPLVVRIAKGNLAATAAAMLLASLGTIIIMPLVIPFVIPGLSVSAWSIARPLIWLVLLPLAVGLAVRLRSEAAASQLFRYAKPITGLGTIVFLAVVIVLHFRSFIGAIGSGAFAAQIAFVIGLAFGGYLIAGGLSPDLKSVTSLSICTRNIGAAAAIVGTAGDQQIMVMLVIATLVTVLVSFIAAWMLARMEQRSARAASASH